MKNKLWTTHKDWKARILKNPAIKREYDAMETEFQIARQMIDIRIKKDITQSELAQKAGTGQAVISRLEMMNAKPSIALLKRIAHALGTKLEISINP